jgi:hypothetical protein
MKTLYMIYSTETGEELRDVPDGFIPNPGPGEAAVKRPGSARTEPPAITWDPASRVFVEPRAIDAVDAFALLTEAELTSILSSGVAAVIGLVLGMILTTLRGQKVALTSTYHLQGALLLRDTGFLTQTRYEQFRDGISPTLQ